MVAAAIIGGAVVGGIASSSAASKAAKAQTAAANTISDSSEYAADLQYKLGAEELAYAKEQDALNRVTTERVTNAQLASMDELNRQGKDYYDYMVASQRPVESALNAEAMAAGGELDQEQAAARAGADVQAGIDSAREQKMRVMSSMGVNPNSGRFAAGAASDAVAEGAVMAGAKNTARTGAKNLGYAKRLDVAGLYRGLAGASQGAYGTANNSGNSAVSNTLNTSSLAQRGMASANQTTIGGANTAMQGAMSIAGILSKPDLTMENFGMSLGGNLMGAGLGKWMG